MSIKQYTAEELLAELAARVRPDSPLYDPQELRDMLIKSESECSELRAQVERLRFEVLGIEEQKRQAEMERDALQARIDAGVRVWGKDLGNGEWSWGYGEYNTIDTHTALVIDIKPIADHIVDANKMVDDDRKGDADRRAGFARGSCHRVNQTDDTRGKYRTAVPNTRRRTPGTKADRKQPERRKGERRKVQTPFDSELRVMREGKWCPISRNRSGANERRKS